MIHKHHLIEIMIRTETKSFGFSTSQTTKKKIGEVRALAERIRSAKNDMSVFVHSSFDYFFDTNISKYSFNAHILNNMTIDLPSQVKTEAIEDVYEKYSQRRDCIKKQILDLMLVSIRKREYYKKNVTINGYIVPSGSIKEIKYKKYKSDLTVFTATLSLFNATDIDDLYTKFIAYINKNLNSINTAIDLINSINSLTEKEENELSSNIKSKERFEKMLSYINNRQLYERCYIISRSRRERYMKKYSYYIAFNTLNFRGRSKVAVFLDKNRNSVRNFKIRKHNSVINAFLDFGGVIKSRKHLYIPVKYSKTYHGNLSDFRKVESESKSYNYQYIIVFNEYDKFKIQITKKVDVDWTEVSDNMRVVGGDQNIKHNLEQFSDGQSIDWPRKEIEELIRIELKIDEQKKKKKELEKQVSIIREENIGKSMSERTPFAKEVSEVKQTDNSIKQLRIAEKKCQKRISGIVTRSISAVLKSFCDEEGNSNTHLVLEDIDGKFKSNRRLKYKTEDGLEYSQNKIFRLCHFGEIKDMFKRIGRKYSVPVSFVPSYYTSQICPVCGHIDRNNRRTQEDFKCVSCGNTALADTKSAEIISVLYASAVLRNVLLKKDDTGAYVPRSNLSKDKVYDVLQKYSLELVS